MTFLLHKREELKESENLNNCEVQNSDCSAIVKSVVKLKDRGWNDAQYAYFINAYNTSVRRRRRKK